MEERDYSVSEAVQLTGVPSHVLRYWEEELQIAIRRTNQGHRIYAKKDLELFRQVKEWKEKGIQLKAIRVLLGHECEDQKLEAQIRSVLHLDESEQENRLGWEGDPNQEECSGQEGNPDQEECSGQEGNPDLEECSKQEGDPNQGSDFGQEDDLDQSWNSGQQCGSDQETHWESYEIVTASEPSDHMQQFEAILKQLIEEIMEEQNKKMEETLTAAIRDEIEALYIQYIQLSVQEAAAASPIGKKRGNRWMQWIRKRLRRTDI